MKNRSQNPGQRTAIFHLSFVICHFCRRSRRLCLENTEWGNYCRSTWWTQSSQIGQVLYHGGTAMPRSDRGTGVSPVSDWCSMRGHCFTIPRDSGTAFSCAFVVHRTSETAVNVFG